VTRVSAVSFSLTLLSASARLDTNRPSCSFLTPFSRLFPHNTYSSPEAQLFTVSYSPATSSQLLITPRFHQTFSISLKDIHLFPLPASQLLFSITRYSSFPSNLYHPAKFSLYPKACSISLMSPFPPNYIHTIKCFSTSLFLLHPDEPLLFIPRHSSIYAQQKLTGLSRWRDSHRSIADTMVSRCSNILSPV
jgi:hypothetical protein